jgi:hypothetical protein
MSARCDHWIGAEQRYCGATDGVRQYLNSKVCPLHTPSALAGKPEPAPGPDRPAVQLAATVRATPANRRPLTAVPDPT